jgi:DNA-binding response OmpR family regulator
MNADAKELILVVDDEPAIRDLLSMVLREQGYRVISAGDGEEALTVAISQKPDLILLDINMPKLDGMATCAKLRINAVTHNIPVIFLTAYNSHDRLEQAIDMGANDFLGKPINLVELGVRVRAMLRTKNVPDEVERLEAYIKTMKELRSQAAGSPPAK